MTRTTTTTDDRPDGLSVDTSDPGVLGSLLGRRLTELFGGEVSVPTPTRLTGGTSLETWSFTARLADGGRRALVLRRDPPGLLGRPGGMAREAAVIEAAEACGVPVARVVDSGGDPAVLGAPYLISEFLEGETIARRLLRDPAYAEARKGMATELGRVLARIHTIPVAAVPDLPSGDPLAQLREKYDRLGEPLPALEIAMKWLDRHRPAPVPDAVVHGDFRTGNLIIAPSGLRAVLDWEVVRRGDPREDLGWLCVKCWRFGSPHPAGGFGSMDQLLDGYAEIAGQRPDPEAVRWWQVFGTALWAVGCRGMAERHLSGQTPSVELAAIGRRVPEQEHDVLLALGLPADTDQAAEPDRAAARSDLHGRPDAAHLLAAVSTFLREEVMALTDDRLNFVARVAANVLDGVERELLLGAELETRHRERLTLLGQRDQAGLAAAIRDGRLADDDPVLLAAVRAAVTDKLLARYLTHPA